MLRFIQRIIIVLFVLSIALFAVSSLKTAKLRDTDGPEISMDADSVTTSIDCTPEDILAGVTASDRKDGDVSDSLVVQGLSNFIEKGRRQATLAAFDSDNNVTKVTREVIYDDYVSPRFSLEAPLRFTVNQMSEIDTISASLTVTDCLDGDLSSNITISSTDDTYWPSALGDYSVMYQVTNSAGDVAALPVTVEVYDTAEDSGCPKVVLSDYLIYTKVGEKIVPMDYVEGITLRGMTYDLDELDGEITGYTQDDIHVTDPVDIGTPGVYEIVYSMYGEDNYRSKIRLIVVVE